MNPSLISSLRKMPTMLSNSSAFEVAYKLFRFGTRFEAINAKWPLDVAWLYRTLLARKELIIGSNRALENSKLYVKL